MGSEPLYCGLDEVVLASKLDEAERLTGCGSHIYKIRQQKMKDGRRIIKKTFVNKGKYFDNKKIGN